MRRYAVCKHRLGGLRGYESCEGRNEAGTVEAAGMERAGVGAEAHWQGSTWLESPGVGSMGRRGARHSRPSCSTDARP
jgi:hypothetical protein